MLKNLETNNNIWNKATVRRKFHERNFNIYTWSKRIPKIKIINSFFYKSQPETFTNKETLKLHWQKYVQVKRCTNEMTACVVWDRWSLRLWNAHDYLNQFSHSLEVLYY